jgi:hypothetical protein
LKTLRYPFESVSKGDQHQLFWTGQVWFGVCLAFQNTQLLAKQGNFQVFFLSCYPCSGQGIEQQAHET